MAKKSTKFGILYDISKKIIFLLKKIELNT